MTNLERKIYKKKLRFYNSLTNLLLNISGRLHGLEHKFIIKQKDIYAKLYDEQL